MNTKQSIYLITDGFRLRKAGTLIPIIEKVLASANGVVKFVQLREQKENQVSDRELKPIIKELLLVCRKYQVKLIINASFELALECASDGVHLNSKQKNISEIRRQVEADFIIGHSTHSLEGVIEAEKECYDYVFLSPIFKPISKSISDPNLGLDYLANAVRATKIPIYALAGIELNNCKEVLETGVSGVAMISSVLLAEDPVKAIEKFVKLF